MPKKEESVKDKFFGFIDSLHNDLEATAVGIEKISQLVEKNFIPVVDKIFIIATLLEKNKAELKREYYYKELIVVAKDLKEIGLSGGEIAQVLSCIVSKDDKEDKVGLSALLSSGIIPIIIKAIGL